MPLGVDFFEILMDFWYQNEGKLVPKLDQKWMLTSKDDFLRIVLSLQRGLDFSGSGGPSWEPKTIKNRSKNAIQDGMHLDIDFFNDFDGFWDPTWDAKSTEIGLTGLAWRDETS